ncbi:hypothetical protein [Aureitalea marina]|uniref:Lipoprotein n=1 Tax=Aureitalea marina TaxID=930804 RepID=A0A2S7KQV5_9FLAO|nr:hypothetical protein [Aureitalea marina]PQB05005.1 hypothetical protein BST85_08955 [Aureitalea marina]
MIYRFFFALALVLVASSCQFVETMEVREDGSGKIAVSMDMSEMMTLSQLAQDSTLTKTDTIIRMRDFLEQKKDSIATLPAEEQKRLKELEDFSFRTYMDPDGGKMDIEVFTEFDRVDEIGDLMAAFEKSGDFMSGFSQDENSQSAGDSSEGLIGVKFSMKNGVFKRDAFIRDPQKHKQQMDSVASAESFLEGMRYTLRYTFPKRIKNASAKDAKLSLDGKTIEVDRSFLAYFKDPDILDLEVELED